MSAAAPLRQETLQIKRGVRDVPYSTSPLRVNVGKVWFPTTNAEWHFWSHFVKVAIGKLSSGVSWEGGSVQK